MRRLVLLASLLCTSTALADDGYCPPDAVGAAPRTCDATLCVGTFRVASVGRSTACLFAETREGKLVATTSIGTDVGRTGARLLEGGVIQTLVMVDGRLREGRWTASDGAIVDVPFENEETPAPAPTKGPTLTCARDGDHVTCGGGTAPKKERLNRARWTCAKAEGTCAGERCLFADADGCAVTTVPEKTTKLTPALRGRWRLTLNDGTLCIEDDGGHAAGGGRRSGCTRIGGESLELVRPNPLPDLRVDGRIDVPPSAGDTWSTARATRRTGRAARCSRRRPPT